MKWVTRERPKVDRIACPWLIQRFVDPDAEFLFVPADRVLAVAERDGAIPIAGAGRHRGGLPPRLRRSLRRLPDADGGVREA
jgi:hypothetical protein